MEKVGKEGDRLNGPRPISSAKITLLHLQSITETRDEESMVHSNQELIWSLILTFFLLLTKTIKIIFVNQNNKTEIKQ